MKFFAQIKNNRLYQAILTFTGWSGRCAVCATVKISTPLLLALQLSPFPLCPVFSKMCSVSFQNRVTKITANKEVFVYFWSCYWHHVSSDGCQSCFFVSWSKKQRRLHMWLSYPCLFSHAKGGCKYSAVECARRKTCEI